MRLAYSFSGGNSWVGPETIAAAGGSSLTSNVNAVGQGWATWKVGESFYAAPFTAADSVPPAKVVTNSNGSITVTFVPAEAGEATLVVTVPAGSIARASKCKTGQIKLKGRCVPAQTSVGRASAHGKPGMALKLKVTLSSKVRALLSKGKTEHVTATLTYKPASGASPTVRVYKLTIKGKTSRAPLAAAGPRAAARAARCRRTPPEWMRRTPTMPDMEGSMAETGARSWLRCYRCWSQDLEVQVHYEGIHKIDPQTGERAEVVDELQEAVVQCLDCMHDQPHLGFTNGRVEPIEDRWERMIAGTPWVASCTVAVDADDVESCSGPEAGDQLSYAAFGDHGVREFFTHVRFHKHEDDTQDHRAPARRALRPLARGGHGGARVRRTRRSDDHLARRGVTAARGRGRREPRARVGHRPARTRPRRGPVSPGAPRVCRAAR